VFAALFRNTLHQLFERLAHPHRIRNTQLELERGAQFSHAGDHVNALRAYIRAVALTPNNAETHFRLGLECRDQNKLDSAASSYRNAIKLRPDYIEAINNLGSVLQMQGNTGEALTAYRRAVALQPGFAQPYLNLGRLLASLGEREKASTTYRAAIHLDIDADSFRHLLSALGGETTLRAPEEYTRNLFDNFAAHFDRRLVDELGYGIPELFASRIKALQPRRDLRIIDLGCGTGLCGVHLAGCFSSMHGIDLSPAMLDIARLRNLYDTLLEQDICDWQKQSPVNAIDVVLAADVFIYLGSLLALFATIGSALAKDGLFAFSIELTTESDFALQPSGRYAHSLDYVRGLGLQFRMQEVEGYAALIRGDVSGFVFIFRKS
jgi:predicted TPR repeat methyltransferase